MGSFHQSLIGCSPETQAFRYQDLATVALQQYALDAPTPAFLQHNSGITYRVTTATTGTSFLLKIHDPVGEGTAEPVSTTQARIAWFAKLAQAGLLQVQVPIRARSGALVTLVKSDPDAASVACTLQAWIEGTHPEGDFTADQIALVGGAMARFHGYSATHPTTLPAVGAIDLHQDVRQLEEAVSLQILSSAQYHVILRTSDMLDQIATELGQDHAVWGPIHGDIHHGNILFQNQGIAFIDFDTVCNGPYLLDLATTLYHILHQEAAIRQRFIASYTDTRPLTRAHISYLEAFVAWAAIRNLAFQISIPAQRTSLAFARNLRQVADRFCPQVLTREPFVAV